MKRAIKRGFIVFGLVGVLVTIPFSGYGADLSIGNTITGNGDMTLLGIMSATSFSGDGSGLTNISGAEISTGTVSSGALATGSVTSDKVAANAIWPLNIAFLGNVAIVAPSGGDYENPETAMTSYAAWCVTPSADTPCLLKIMPGKYTVTAPVVMQPYIDIEGSGEKVTKITAALSFGSFPPLVSTVKGANNAELRFLTVENTGTGAYTVAIWNTSASPSLSHVTATASGGTNNIGIFNLFSSPAMTNVTATASGGTSANYGVFNYSSSSPMMTNVTVTGTGGGDSYGVYNYSFSSPTMTNVTATASGGTNANYGVYNNYGGTVKINNSVIKGTTNTINNNGDVLTRVGNTQLDGGPVYNEGTLTCVGAYDASYVALDTNCTSP